MQHIYHFNLIGFILLLITIIVFNNEIEWGGNMRKSILGICVLILMLVLAACTSNNGNKEAGSSTEATASPSASTQQSEQPSAAAPAFPRQVESAGGAITIEKQPLKIGLASWQLVEMLLPFDLSSAAITLPFASANSVLESDALKPYVDKFDQLEIVGEDTKVNLETMLAYAPDVIIAGSNTNKEIKAQLEQIATTVWIDEEKINIRNSWPEVVTLIGNIIGQEERAKEVIERFAALQQEGKEKLATHSGETVLFVQVREKAVYVMPPSGLTRYYEGLGLTPPPNTENLPAYGQITLEGLSEINPDHLFLGHFNYTNKSLAALTDDWQNSEVWKSLKAVKNNRVYPLNGELSLGLGPIGQTYGLETIIASMK